MRMPRGGWMREDLHPTRRTHASSEGQAVPWGMRSDAKECLLGEVPGKREAVGGYVKEEA